MKHILLFGAGKSATVLIDYLKDLASSHIYSVTVADASYQNALAKTGKHELVKPTEADVEDEIVRKSLIEKADLVISMLPPALHYLVALDCVACNKHLLTASYIDEKLKTLQNDIEEKGLLFLCEMGLDPGIDHMSAMSLIGDIKAKGGKITSFKSHCGGLVAPENDDNPWHYKISWNPQNIVLAGKAGAKFREDGRDKFVPYDQLFTAGSLVAIDADMLLAYYPNRDSLGYLHLYQLETISTFIRTTLRHPDFCFGWKNIIDLKLTEEEPEYDTDGMSLATFFKLHFEKYGFNDWLNEMLKTRLSFARDIMENLVQLIESESEAKGFGDGDETFMLVNEDGKLDTLEIDDVKGKAAATLAVKMHEANLSLKQLFFLGLDSEELINRGRCSAAQVLQFILEKKLSLQKTDKDLVVMMHEIAYEWKGKTYLLKSSLVVKGEDHLHTAMAKTVGLPLGIAAKLLLEGLLTTTGLHIPILREIYEPVLAELKRNGIEFHETEEEI